jgi:ferredoxin-NADP reductase
MMPVAVPSRWQEARIERIQRHTPRMISVYLRSQLARQAAGQHLDVRLTAPDGYQAQRSYSIASAPGASSLELAIERLDDGEVSPFFHDVAQPGDAIEVRGPIGGHFIWSAAVGGPLLLIAGGSGIAPLMAIARERAATAAGTAALLLFSARTWDDLVYRDELQQLAAADPSFHFIATTTRGPRKREDDFARRLDPPMLHEILRRWERSPRHSYVCGSNRFVETATSALVTEGLPPSSLRAERYGGTV